MIPHIGEGNLETALVSKVYDVAAKLLVTSCTATGESPTRHDLAVCVEIAADLFDWTCSELVRRTNRRIDELNAQQGAVVAGGAA